MERALVEEDPKLASTLRGTSQQQVTRRRVVLGGVVLVAGIALLVGGVLTGQAVLGVLGFVVMLGGGLLAITVVRSPQGVVTPKVRDSGRGGLGVVDGGRRSRQRGGGSPFMARVEERWRRRRERGY
jgi:hypothetical protein